MTMNEPTKPRVLLIAEAANPEWVSVPLTGWSNARALAQIVDAHLITQIRNREAILRAGLVEGRDFTAIDSEAIARPAFQLASALRGGDNKGWTTLSAFGSLTYPYFEWLVWRTFGPQIIAGKFQIVHRLTPLSPTAPSLLARRCRRTGVHFVLGPINGGLPWPWQFDRVRRQEKEWLSYVRSAYKLLPGFRSTLRNAAAILIGSINTWEQMSQRYRSKCFYVEDPGIEPDRFPNLRTRRAMRPIRAIFVGRLVPYKGADMLLEAAAPLIRSGALTLDIIGDGPQMPELQEILRLKELGDGVKLHGWVDHGRITNFLLESDLFTFPSIREFGGAVVQEAMAVGLVPIVVDYGGPAEFVTEQTGFLVKLGNRRQVIEQLRSILTCLANEPSLIETKSQAAIRRAREHFTWRSKAERILEVYRWLLGQRPEKPSFPMPAPDPDDELNLSRSEVRR
jgi:glycosyltransferase involved in cell wall biosynthesis